MADWSAWFDEVLPDVPGCPQDVATNAIRNAAIELCERSRVYLVDHPPISAVANQAAYAWAPGAGLKVVRAESVWFDGVPLAPITSDDLAARYPKWSVEAGTPRGYLQEGLDTLTLVPKPSADMADAITAKVVVAPSRAATGILDALWERYLEAIASGAKARLMSIPEKPYSNPKEAERHAAAFDDAIARARLAAFRGHGRARNNSNLGRRRFF